MCGRGKRCHQLFQCWQLPAIQSVANALRSAGMNVTNEIPKVGVIAGEVSQANMQALAAVPGAVAVEPDQEMYAI